MQDVKKKKINEENLVQDTQGAEMPDPNRKQAEKASEAAETFKRAKQVDEKQVPKKAAS